MNYFIFSYGGCGSTLLASFLGNFGRTYHLHDPEPPPFLTLGHTGVPGLYAKAAMDVRLDMSAQKVHAQNSRAIYITRDPVDSLLSRPSWQHCAHIGGEWEDFREWANKVPVDPSIMKSESREIFIRKVVDKVIDSGHDHMMYEKHFDSWMNKRKNYDVLFLKYDDMWKDLDKILEFCNIDPRFSTAFPAKKETAKKIDESKKIALRSLYSDLVSKIDNLKTHVQQSTA